MDREADIEETASLRKLARRCAILLERLQDDENAQDEEMKAKQGFWVSRQRAEFNLWCAKIGVNDQGQRSIDVRLKDVPETLGVIRGLVESLEIDLKRIRHPDNNSTPISAQSSDSDSESNGSLWFDSLSSLEDTRSEDSGGSLTAEEREALAVKKHVEDTVERLHGHALQIDKAGAKHRQKRLKMYQQKEGPKYAYQGYKEVAYRKAQVQFPAASDSFHYRMAESFARRRIRLDYLREHQKKRAIESMPQDAGPRGHSHPKIRRQGSLKNSSAAGQYIPPTSQAPSKQHTENEGGKSIYSTTENTKFDKKLIVKKQERPESVASIATRHPGFPPAPQITGTSFQCPYCRLEFRAAEAEKSRWIQHVMQDFEPYFCIFDDCNSPFDMENTFYGFLEHLHGHVEERYHVDLPNGEHRTFDEAGLEGYLRQQEPATDMAPLKKFARRKGAVLLDKCPFCGGYPDILEKDFPDSQTYEAQMALRRHIKQHMQDIAIFLPPCREDVFDKDDQSSIFSCPSLGDLEDSQTLCDTEGCDCKTSGSLDDEPSAPFEQLQAVNSAHIEATALKFWMRDYAGKFHLTEEDCIRDKTLRFLQAARRSTLKNPSLRHSAEYDNYANLLADLRVTDPRDDKKRIQEAKGGLLTDSYVWVLQNFDFCQWRDDQDNRLLWVKGDPGKGKTMLLCGIVDELEATRAQGRILSYFFCQATDERLNTATAVLRSLIFMLLDQDPSLVSYITKEYDIAGKDLFQGKNAWHAMSEIFTNMLHDSKLQGVYLLIDALDECSTGLDQLLCLIAETSKSTDVKWLVSSRNWLQIEEQLRTVAQRLSLEVNASSVSTAVDSYIMSKVSHLSQLKDYQDDIASQVRQYLSSNADGTFLWVALVCQELERTSKWHALYKMESFPRGLDALYEWMMQQINREEDAELCRQILALVATTYRPLSLAETTTLMEDCDYLADDESLQVLKNIINLCGSFLTIRIDTIYFVHRSAKDFLLNKAYAAFDQIFPDGIAHQHHAIFSRSLDVLSRTLRRDIYELRNPGSSIDDTSPPNPDPLASLKYSSTHWVDHLERSNPADPSRSDLQDNASVHAFLKRHYLHWLEAQSLLQGMPQAVVAMRKLQTLASLETQLAELIQDACRFVLSYKRCIESFPLQLYIAALLFSPTHSLMRQLFQSEALAWITMITNGDVDWNACQQTLEGHSHSVNSVAFSPDGRQLASGSYDNTVKLWDTATGQCHQTLEGHSDSVFSVAFSPDGRQLASGSRDSTVKLWDTATGQCQQMLEGHSSLENVFEVAIQGPTRDLIGQRYMLSQQDVWITNRAQNILWLPPEYRASSHAEDGSKIAVGCRSGRVLLLCFESEYQQA